MKNVLAIMPQRIKSMLELVPRDILNETVEIRLRVGKPMYLYSRRREYGLGYDGVSVSGGDVFTQNDANCLWRNISDYSPYTLLEFERQGFVTIEGGHRIGICGELAAPDGKIKFMRSVQMFCIRIAHACEGCCIPVVDYIFDTPNVLSSLIVSPPGCGKTTLLRDLARFASNCGYNVCIADERNEISACKNGVPTLDVGKRTDVSACVAKDRAMVNMIRSMRPDILIADEIATQADKDAVIEAAHSGVSVFASLHAASYDDIVHREGYASLVTEANFKRVILLSSACGAGTVDCVLDRFGKPAEKRKCR